MKDTDKKDSGWYAIPGAHILEDTIEQMTKFERWLLYFFMALLVVACLTLLGKVNAEISTEVPTQGGTHTEGVIGTPRFINPLLANSSADRDLTQLVYSGLLAATPKGNLVLDLAKNYSISDDGLTYTFTLKDDVTFHDGHPVTADDVVFTVRKAQNSALRSPKQGNWDGVAVEKVDNKTVKFTLEEPYSPFLQNATLGILPEHLWGSFSTNQFSSSKYNTQPVGSGPYKIASISRDSSGIPQYYVLKPFKEYARGTPYIENLIFRFYSNQERLVSAYKNGTVEAINSISADKTEDFEKEGERILTHPLPRVFGVFFNQNNADIFTNRTVRRALKLATDKEKIVSEVLHGYAKAVDGPVPPEVFRPDDGNVRITAASGTSARKTAQPEKAAEVLENEGWEKNDNGIYEKDGTTLSFSISTSNAAELKETARMVEKMWEDFGAGVELEFFEIGSLNQDVIRPREYETLLFGQVIGRGLDFYPFWHSSQRNDPGLNVAMYTNITADDLLEEMRDTADPKERQTLYREFESVIQEDIPAVFLYSPDFTYLFPKKVKGVDVGTVTTPAERFLDVHTWYIKTESIWNIFADK